MLTIGDVLTKTLVKSQKMTFGNKNIALDASICRWLLEMHLVFFVFFTTKNCVFLFFLFFLFFKIENSKTNELIIFVFMD